MCCKQKSRLADNTFGAYRVEATTQTIQTVLLHSCTLPACGAPQCHRFCVRAHCALLVRARGQDVRVRRLRIRCSFMYEHRVRAAVHILTYIHKCTCIVPASIRRSNAAIAINLICNCLMPSSMHRTAAYMYIHVHILHSGK